MLITGIVAGVKALFHFDDGAEVNDIDESFCNRHGNSIHSSIFIAELANGAEQALQEISHSVEVQTKEYTKYLIFVVSPL